MKVRFLQNLGRLDAEAVNKATGDSIDWAECKLGSVVDLSPGAVAILRKKHPALLTAIDGVSPAAAIQGVPESRGKEKGAVKE